MDINQFDQIIVGLSGGKDSTAVALWVKFESGWDLSKVRFVFFDTGNEDNFTYSFLSYLEEVIGKIETVFEGYSFYDSVKKNYRFPSRMARFCTRELKIEPKFKLFSNLLDQGVKVLSVTGVRREYDPFYWKGKNYVLNLCHPIAYLSLDDVFALHSKYLSLEKVQELVEVDQNLSVGSKVKLLNVLSEQQIPYNPLYAMGASRVGCFPCINSRKSEIRSMAKFRPERIDFLRDEEEKTSLLRKGVETYTPFFAPKLVPVRFRSKRIIMSDGTVKFVATIDDVVSWSKTGKSAKGLYIPENDDSVCQIGKDCE